MSSAWLNPRAEFANRLAAARRNGDRQLFERVGVEARRAGYGALVDAFDFYAITAAPSAPRIKTPERTPMPRSERPLDKTLKNKSKDDDKSEPVDVDEAVKTAKEWLADPDASPKKKAVARQLLDSLNIEYEEEEKAARAIGKAMGFATGLPGVRREGRSLVLGTMTPAQARAFLRSRGEAQ